MGREFARSIYKRKRVPISELYGTETCNVAEHKGKGRPKVTKSFQNRSNRWVYHEILNVDLSADRMSTRRVQFPKRSAEIVHRLSERYGIRDLEIQVGAHRLSCRADKLALNCLVELVTNVPRNVRVVLMLRKTSWGD